ncbi:MULTISPECIES: hypothetical protein [unclassified Blastococcus]
MHPDKRLEILTAFAAATADPSRLGALLGDAADDSDAVRRLQTAYGFTPGQARAVLDLQLARITREHRARLQAEIDALRDAAAGLWDPPIEVTATARSGREIVVGLPDHEHDVHGDDSADCLDRMVVLVRDELAGPRRRRVTVTFTATVPDGPRTVHVDPVGSASFCYDDLGTA